MFNYKRICQSLFKDLPERTKDVILARFGLKTGKRQTLEAIGQNHGITRERVRQIENDGFLKLRTKIKKEEKVFQYFGDQLKTTGNLRKEDILLWQLGGSKNINQVFFLLTLGEQFERFSETKDFWPLWTINSDSLTLAQKMIDSFLNKLQEAKELLSLEDLSSSAGLSQVPLISYLEISKKIYQGPEGLFGLKEWPEINPRGVKDRAYLVFKKEKKPLHFTEVAKLIGKPALPQTVHNELIRDPRFVLVGRGLYALGEWGYEPGVIKDVIFKILEKAQQPLTKEEIIERVLKQRLVKANTILLNLNNKKYFQKIPEGKYTIQTIKIKNL